MIRAAMGGTPFRWPAGVYVPDGDQGPVMMAMETTIDRDGVRYKVPHGTAGETESLHASYLHLVKLRDEVIGMGILPPVSEWGNLNPHLR